MLDGKLVVDVHHLHFLPFLFAIIQLNYFDKSHRSIFVTHLFNFHIRRIGLFKGKDISKVPAAQVNRESNASGRVWDPNQSSPFHQDDSFIQFYKNAFPMHISHKSQFNRPKMLV